MKVIESRDNALFKSFVRTSTGKVRSNAWLEGVHLCQAWLEHQVTVPEFAIFDASRLEQNAELQDIFRAVPEHAKVVLAPTLMKKLSQVQEGQGVAFIVSPPTFTLSETINTTALWLDRVQDPGNMGTLLLPGSVPCTVPQGVLQCGHPKFCVVPRGPILV